MSLCRLTTGALLALVCVFAAPAQAAPITEHVPSTDDRYSLAGGCFALRSEKAGAYVVKAGGTYTATGAAVGDAEPFRMQATDLGSYLLYGPDEDFMARNGSTNGTTAANAPSEDADWTVAEDAGAFRLTVVGRALAVSAGNALVTVNGDGGPAGRFGFQLIDDSRCADYPEVEVNVEGPLPNAHPADSPVRGFAETHMHGMAFHFLGTKAHCGRPWHRFGAPYALVDCDDHTASGGCGAALENTVSFGNPAGCHDPVGWPTFKDWPNHRSLTHEQSYYKWLERAWRSGMRLYVNLMVENRVLCEIYPLTPQPSTQNCNEMDSVRAQVDFIHEFQDYIDAQWGGRGKGWFRIVQSPAAARAAINDGKLAVVKGMEVSEPFDCRLTQPGDVPTCNAGMVAEGVAELDEDLGIRQVELVNKFDNALSGIAGDSGTTGTVTNLGNFYSAGTFWDLEHCDDAENSDHSPAALQHNDDAVIANGLDAFGDTTGITFPIYGPDPHCNQRGLYPLGALAIKDLMARGMIFDPDHMSVIARDQALDLVEAASYPGVMTSHSWSTDDAYRRIAALGGLNGPSAKSAASYVEKWRKFNDRGYPGLTPTGRLYAVGYGADMNGFASQGGPPPESGRITYPFRSPIDPTVSVCRQQSGERTFDYNVDGTAHYGLYADWIEAVRIAAGDDGDEIIDDLANGAEAYLQMWERAEGTPGAGGTAPAPGGGGEPEACVGDDGGGGGGGGAGGGGANAGSSGSSSGGADKVCAKKRAKAKRAGAKKKKRRICGRLR